MAATLATRVISKPFTTLVGIVSLITVISMVSTLSPYLTQNGRELLMNKIVVHILMLVAVTPVTGNIQHSVAIVALVGTLVPMFIEYDSSAEVGQKFLSEAAMKRLKTTWGT